MKLRGGISGFGEVAAQAHLPGWLTRPDIQIAAVHDPIPERRHLALRLIKNVRVYEDLDLMLDGEQLDFLDVASPPALHVHAARSALEAGAHVIVEKPLCLDLKEFDALKSLAAANSRVMMCVHNWKYSTAYHLAHEIVASGRLGALRYLALERLRTQPAGAAGAVPTGSVATGPGWRLDPASGGGILIDHGWHVFYLMCWLMGDAPVEVSARLGSLPGLTVDDMADLRVVFADGSIGYSHLSWRAPVRRTSAMLYGENAILGMDGDRMRLTDRSGKSRDFTAADPSDDSYHASWFAGVAAEFETAIKQTARHTAEVNLAEARSALAIILAARESHRAHGTPVRIAANCA